MHHYRNTPFKMSQELKTITINSLGETEKHDFPINGKVSDIKSFYENIYGYEFYFKIIKGTDILSDDFPIADIDEDITIVILNIAELLKQQKCSTKDEPNLPKGFKKYYISNYYFITEDKYKLFLKNMIEIINIDPSSIWLKICKILYHAEDYIYGKYDLEFYIKFRKYYNVNIKPIKFDNNYCLNKYHKNYTLYIFNIAKICRNSYYGYSLIQKDDINT